MIDSLRCACSLITIYGVDLAFQTQVTNLHFRIICFNISAKTMIQQEVIKILSLSCMRVMFFIWITSLKCVTKKLICDESHITRHTTNHTAMTSHGRIVSTVIKQLHNSIQS